MIAPTFSYNGAVTEDVNDEEKWNISLTINSLLLIKNGTSIKIPKSRFDKFSIILDERRSGSIRNGRKSFSFKPTDDGFMISDDTGAEGTLLPQSQIDEILQLITNKEDK